MACNDVGSFFSTMFSLYKPISIHACNLRNRFVMAPMTRAQSPGNLPNEQNKIYYTARAAGGVGLIITEGTYINAYAGDAGFQDPTAVPNFYGEECIEGWKKIVESVHDAQGRIETLSKQIEKGEFDFVALGRALIADADLPNKILKKDFEKIIPFKKEMVNTYP